jgi:L,D-peptidoglycan transpeptidase YkuD (ErfK/YbiS/YcfS/YnhG family)
VRSADIVVTPMGARFMGRMFPCTTGRNGVTQEKREGDHATPAGVHSFVGLLYRPDRIARSTLPDWALPIRPRDGWSDDPRDEDYNLIVRHPHPYSAERLWRADPMYDVILLTNWNWPYAVRGAGSAIFVHTWRSPGHTTAGCVAFGRADLLWIANRIRHETRLIVTA